MTLRTQLEQRRGHSLQYIGPMASIEKKLEQFQEKCAPKATSVSEALSFFSPFFHYSAYFSLFNNIYFAIAVVIYILDFPLIENTAAEAPWWSVIARRAPRVMVRNAILVSAVYSYWHNLLYVRKASDKKMNPKQPKNDQHRRDTFWTMVGSQIASGCVLCLVNVVVNI